ncbi:MAG: 5'(3')-deoxyribonucleotidase [Bacteroidota bacterium]
MDKLSIAIDMDEVIADPIDKFITLYQRDHGYNYTLDQMHGKEFGELLPPELTLSLREYLNQKGFFRDLKVIPDSQEVIAELTKKYDVYIVSAATEFPLSLEDKQAWLGDHFPFISWTNIMFCGHKIVNTDIMIDDRTKNFVKFNGRKLLFTSPHNVTLTEYERVNNWKEVAEKLL